MPAKSAKPERKTLTMSMPALMYPEGVIVGKVRRVHTYATKRTRFTAFLDGQRHDLGTFDTYTEAHRVLCEAYRAARQG